MIEWWGPIIWELYGAVEGSGTIVDSNDWLQHPGTVGRPVPGSAIKILGDDGEELPPGSVGTIYLTRYLGDRFEYLHDREKTEAAHRGEFFTVGDVGYLDQEGFLFLCDRKIDMINVGGLKVYSAEVENVLTLHPQVVDCAVIGVPDEITGEAVVALVQIAPDSPEVDALRADLSRFLLRHLSPLKMPRSYEFVSSLSRDATGKLRKRELRSEYLSNRVPS
jgi:long-chain acyl-CoA synthetase